MVMSVSSTGGGSNKKLSVGACKSYYMNFYSYIVDSGLP